MSFRKEQWEVFVVNHRWSRDYIKNRSSRDPKEKIMFLTGGAGVGISRVIKTTIMTLNKGLLRKNNKARVTDTDPNWCSYHKSNHCLLRLRNKDWEMIFFIR